MIRHHRDACILYKINMCFVKIIWLAIANEVRTAIASSDKIIFIPELKMS